MKGGTKYIVGNWKMNGLLSSANELKTMLEKGADVPENIEIVICPPATLLCGFAEVCRGSRIKLGAQDCSAHLSGAHTGDLSAQMLRDVGSSIVILGHSERRSDHGETSEIVASKCFPVWQSDMKAIVCIGETQKERDEGNTLKVLDSQLAGSIPEGASAQNTIIAYEPVWAIGTGVVASVSDITHVHDHLRNRLNERFGDEGNNFALLYGGSVKPDNATEILSIANVNGALVGGASLKAKDFLSICHALDNQSL